MRFRSLLLVAVLGGLPLSPGLATPPPPYASWTFGLSLSTGQNNQLFSCFLVKVLEDEVLSTEPITREQFVQQVRGMVASKANPEAVDLFTTHDVAACRIVTDEAGMRRINDCPLLDDLWKLRFWEYPFLLHDGQRVGKGWSEEPNNPSPRQMLLLSNYGLRYPTDICMGENVFRLLRDMGDEAWVDNYRKGY